MKAKAQAEADAMKAKAVAEAEAMKAKAEAARFAAEQENKEKMAEKMEIYL